MPTVGLSCWPERSGRIRAHAGERCSDWIKYRDQCANKICCVRRLNVREAAQYLDLEVDTVYRKSRLREVPCVKVGRALKFDVRALDRYIEQHTIETID